ncbi:MAG: hypothetical protein LBC68_13350 [Prevotellaceae bacterium]|jgi:hypothetical protein|nr:hypothetical protein [Prevotellaceae bacterium]
MKTNKYLIKKKYPALEIAIGFKARKSPDCLGVLGIDITDRLYDSKRYHFLEITQKDAKKMINALNGLLKEYKKTRLASLTTTEPHNSNN